MKKKLLPLVWLLIASPLAYSDTLNSTTLRVWCAGDTASRAYCIGYLMGVHGTAQEGIPDVYCNMQATGERLRLTFINQTFAHPELLDETPAKAILGSFVFANVCEVRRPTRPAGSPIS